jgi:hypothetical protein
MVPIDLENVIIEGARRMREGSEINKVVSDLDISLRFPENPREKYRGVQLSVDEWKVVSYVNPKNTIRQIMKALNMSEMEIKKVVFGLHQAGLVEIVRPEPRPDARTRRARPQRQPERKVIDKLINKLKAM